MNFTTALSSEIPIDYSSQNIDLRPKVNIYALRLRAL